MRSGVMRPLSAPESAVVTSACADRSRFRTGRARRVRASPNQDVAALHYLTSVSGTGLLAKSNGWLPITT